MTFTFWTAATTAVLILLVAAATTKRSKENKNKVRVVSIKDHNNDENNSRSSSITKTIRIFQYEGDMAQPGKTPIVPISTLTWFSGWTQDQASVLLKERIRQILISNPWLLGEIVQDKDSNNYYLSFCEKADVTIVDEILQCSPTPISPSLHRNTLMEDIGRILTKHNLVLSNNAGSPHLWKVSMIPNSSDPQDSFALIVSMSHCIGDGQTYYCLWDMLTGRKPVEALEVTRKLNTRELQEDVLGKPEASIMGSKGFLLSMIRGIIMTKIINPLFFGSPKIKMIYFYVDERKVKLLKENAIKRSGTDFVSTNDVLTSWYFSNSQAQHGLMAVNFRNRLKGHTDSHAGNYENVLYYQIPMDIFATTEDEADPTLIRKSVSTLKRAITGKQSFPSTLRMAREDWCIISNWASFSTSLSLNMGPDCKQELHLPVFFDVASQVPSTLRSCIIFQATPEKLAVVLSGSTDKMTSLMHAPFEDECPFQ